MSIERIRCDRVLHEALTARPDPLHLPWCSACPRATASKYTLIACDLLADQPAEAAQEHHYVSGEPGGIPSYPALKPSPQLGWLRGIHQTAHVLPV